MNYYGAVIDGSQAGMTAEDAEAGTPSGTKGGRGVERGEQESHLLVRMPMSGGTGNSRDREADLHVDEPHPLSGYKKYFLMAASFLVVMTTVMFVRRDMMVTQSGSSGMTSRYQWMDLQHKGESSKKHEKERDEFDKHHMNYDSSDDDGKSYLKEHDVREYERAKALRKIAKYKMKIEEAKAKISKEEAKIRAQEAIYDSYSTAQPTEAPSTTTPTEAPSPTPAPEASPAPTAPTPGSPAQQPSPPEAQRDGGSQGDEAANKAQPSPSESDRGGGGDPGSEPANKVQPSPGGPPGGPAAATAPGGASDGDAAK